MKLKTNKNVEFEIDDEDFILFPNDCNFSANSKGAIQYWDKDKKRSFFVSRVVMKIPEDNGMDVDHWDRDRNNCKKSNLRICTHSQNCCNKKTQCNSTTGYKGVSFYKSHNKFAARFKNKFIGYFNTSLEAAKAYDDFAKQSVGEYARLNL